jgi:rare lipoprotein A
MKLRISALLAAPLLALMTFVFASAPAHAWHETVKSSKSASKSTKKTTIRAARTPDVSSASSYQSGIASYYWQPQPVASGGRFNPEAMTAAHKTLPFGTRVRVTRADNGKSVVVTINDRGPYIAGRIIDLSRRAARDIGMTDIGITKVSVAILR